MMKTLLVKRIDSSFTAFRGSLTRFCHATAAMITMFHHGKIYIAPNLNVSEYILEDKEDELLEKISSLMETDPSIMNGRPSPLHSIFAGGDMGRNRSAVRKAGGRRAMRYKTPSPPTKPLNGLVNDCNE